LTAKPYPLTSPCFGVAKTSLSFARRGTSRSDRVRLHSLLLLFFELLDLTTSQKRLIEVTLTAKPYPLTSPCFGVAKTSLSFVRRGTSRSDRVRLHSLLLLFLNYFQCSKSIFYTWLIPAFERSVVLWSWDTGILVEMECNALGRSRPFKTWRRRFLPHLRKAFPPSLKVSLFMP